MKKETGNRILSTPLKSTAWWDGADIPFGDCALVAQH
jgi:hypothetical protein